MAHTIFEVNSTNASIGGLSNADGTTSLSTPNSSRLLKSYPDGPQHVGQGSAPAGAGLTDGKTLSRAGYRLYYETAVMGGNNSLYVDKSLNGTSHSRNYSANSPPNLSLAVTPEGESTAGTPGATIVASNLGPNVSTKGGDVVDAGSSTSPPFSGDSIANPSVKSGLLSKSSLHIQPPGFSGASASLDEAGEGGSG